MSADQSQTKAKAREPDVDLTLWDSDQEISLSQKATFNDKWCQPTKDAGESDAKPVTTSSSVRKSSADIKKGSSGTGKKSTSTSSDTATSNRSQKLLSSSDQAKKSVRALQAPPVCTTLRGSQGQPIVLDSDDETTSEQVRKRLPASPRYVSKVLTSCHSRLLGHTQTRTEELVRNRHLKLHPIRSRGSRALAYRFHRRRRVVLPAYPPSRRLLGMCQKCCHILVFDLSLVHNPRDCTRPLDLIRNWLALASQVVNRSCRRPVKRMAQRLRRAQLE